MPKEQIQNGGKSKKTCLTKKSYLILMLILQQLKEVFRWKILILKSLLITLRKTIEISYILFP